VTRFGRLALLISALAALHGLVYLPFISPHVTPDSASYIAPAKAILDGGYSIPLPAVDVTGLAIPASAQGAPEHQTYRPPGYPLLLAVVGGGSSGGSRAVLFVLQALIFGATVWLLALTVARLWGERVGLVAAALYALDPFSKRYVSLVLSEIEAGLFAIATAYALVRAWQSRSLRWWASAGALLAALALVRPAFAVFLPLLALAAVAANGPWRKKVLAAVAVLAAGGVLLAPWLAWTDHAAGHATPAVFGEGWNLLLAAHGEGLHHTSSQVGSEPAFIRDFNSVHTLAPTAAELKSDPNAYSHYLYRADARLRSLAEHLYWKRLRHDPAQVAWEVAYRGYFLWQAHEDWFQPTGLALLPARLVDWLTLVLAIAGAAIAFRRGGAGRALSLFLLIFTLVTALGHVEARYAFPVRGLLFGFVALALVSAYPRLPARWRARLGARSSRAPEPSPT
jgi:4-amino-4-deoxy-L-arabinose transferase-like glycosyltransferase